MIGEFCSEIAEENATQVFDEAIFQVNCYVDRLVRLPGTPEEMNKLYVGASPWIIGFHPDESVRMIGLRKNISHILTKDVTISFAKSLLEKPFPTPSEDERQQWLNMINNKLQAQSSPDNMGLDKVSNLKEVLMCSYEAPSEMRTCLADVKGMLAFAMPKSSLGNAMLAPSLNGEVFMNPLYFEGIRQAALKILDYVEGGQKPESNLFDDLRTAFIEGGASKEDAESFTWNVLGLLSTNASNSTEFISDLNLGKTAVGENVALAIISSGALVLDARTKGDGHLYSLPSSVKSHCDSGKTYYFWMAAYLAHREALQNKNQRAASAAAFIGQLGYEMLSYQGGRDPGRFFTSDSFGYYNNMSRTDIAFASAGAVFASARASGSSHLPELNIDAAIKRLLIDGKAQEKLDVTQADDLWTSWGAYGEFSDGERSFRRILRMTFIFPNSRETRPF